WGRRLVGVACRHAHPSFVRDGKQLSIHVLPPRANAARYSVLRWTVLRLGSRASGDRVANLRNAFNRRRSFEITSPNRDARWVFPRHLPLRKRAACRVDQSDSPRCGAEHPGRDSDCLPVLFRGLRPQRKPLHAVLHGASRPFSETDRLSVPLAWCPCSLESSIWHTLTLNITTRNWHMIEKVATTLDRIEKDFNRRQRSKRRLRAELCFLCFFLFNDSVFPFGQSTALSCSASRM